MIETIKKYGKILLLILASILGYEITFDEDHPVADDFEVTTFAEINARPTTSCKVMYHVKADVILSHKLNLVPEKAGAPCNCAAAIPVPYTLDVAFMVEDKGYTREEILSRVPLPEHFKGRYMIGEWHNVQLKYKGREDCPEKPAKDEPKPPVQG